MTYYPMTMFHDDNCPVCRFDIGNLKAHNQDGKLRFIDIADPDFYPAKYGMTLRDFEVQIRAQCADGRMVTGMEVFRLAYQAAGFGWVVAPANWCILRRPADALYRAFARNRHGIGRYFGCFFDALAARQAARRAVQCKNGVCSINTPT
jgi:predicted DCC family thiol-disulfide oxidoreductase YuxK